MSYVRRKFRVPAEPLVEYIEQHGGLCESLERAGIETCLPGTYDPETGKGIRTLEYRRFEKALERGREQGWFDLYWLDAFVIRVFLVHPAGIYPDWFEIADDTTLQDKLAGRVQDDATAA